MVDSTTAMVVALQASSSTSNKFEQHYTTAQHGPLSNHQEQNSTKYSIIMDKVFGLNKSSIHHSSSTDQTTQDNSMAFVNNQHSFVNSQHSWT